MKFYFFSFEIHMELLYQTSNKGNLAEYIILFWKSDKMHQVSPNNANVVIIISQESGCRHTQIACLMLGSIEFPEESLIFGLCL